MQQFGFLIFWLGIGALLAMIASFITDNLVVQTAVFVVSSCMLIPFTKFFADKFTKKETVATNSYSLINKHGIVTSDINPLENIGQVKVNGEIWSAKTEDESILEKGTEIQVIKIDGVKLIVSPIKINSAL